MLTVQRRQTGSLRFCAVPAISQTPPRYRCQPDLALQEAGAVTAAGAEHALTAEQVAARLRPIFRSRHFGDPCYAQLSASCALEIRGGADDGSEMGAFQHLHQPQREAGLRAALDEYLPAGLEAGTFYVT